jgi:hypothetical protein
MSSVCTHPLTLEIEGKLQNVPCGQCISCRLQKSLEWGARCIHEAQMYENNYFLTLTYNNSSLPKDLSINKKDLQLFLKKLRNKVNEPIRFYASGEYGLVCNNCGLSKPNCYKKGCNYFVEAIGRPHYHIIIFNLKIPDLMQLRQQQYTSFNNVFKKGKTHSLFGSKWLENIWGKGFISIGDVTLESAGYTARYTVKKILGSSKEAKERRKKWYKGRMPEFALMSRDPGIGKPWFDKYGLTDVYPKDYFTIDGIKHKPSRYYDSLLEKIKPELLEKIKLKRRENLDELDGLRLWHLNKFKNEVSKKLMRSYENE